ncbi:DUF1189 domain-containing protein [Candidatus Parcubacteria bacterium]|nr:DUF1189 domain-containing protein [Candidatus Parcubacteria bacterium]
MGKISTFFYSLKRTFTSPAYYAEILKAPFSFSLKFFFGFFLVYSLVATAVVTVKYLRPLDDILGFLPDKLVLAYPAELEITVKNGQVSTNVIEPYAIPLSRVEDIFDALEESVLGESTPPIENLLVIDTRGQIEDFSKHRTYALLTKSHLSYLNDEGNIETVSLKEIDELLIDRTAVEQVLEVATPFLGFVVPLLVPLTFLAIFAFLPAGKLFYLLFYSVVLLVISKIVSFSLSYRKCFQLGLHFGVIWVTLSSLASLVGLKLDFPFLQTIFLAVLGVFILLKIKTPVVSSPVPSEGQTPLVPLDEP